MFEMQLLKRMIQIGACAAALVAWLPRAESAKKSACAASWREGESMVKASKLRQAKVAMLKCAAPSCGARLRQECSQRIVEIEADIPTIVPVIKKSDGAPVTDVEMIMDGEKLTSRIDGKAVMVDPGSHEFTFKSAGGVLATYKTVVLPGQRNRSIEVTLRSWGQDPVVRTRVPSGSLAASMQGSNSEDFKLAYEDDDSRGMRFTAPTYVMAAVGALGISGYGVMNYWGNRDNQRLDSCRPDCNPARVNRIRRLYQGALISLGVGAVALAGATYLYFTSDSPSRSAEVAANLPRYRLDVQPTASGSLATWAGSF
jgi:hypothetical protein